MTQAQQQRRVFRPDPNPSEAILAKEWPDSIRREDRNLRIQAYNPGNFTDDHKRNIVAGLAVAQRAKQAEFASECTPQQDGDETIIRLYAEGRNIGYIKKQIRSSYSHARNRLIACHPTATALK